MIRLIFFVVLTGFIGVVNAARLGSLTVESALGEPLEARISVFDVSDSGASDLTVSLGSPAQYAKSGLIYNDLVSNITLEYIRDQSGDFISLMTKEAVNEIVIDLLVELSVQSERVSRTFVAFIDPPLLLEERRLTGNMDGQNVAAIQEVSEGIVEQEQTTNVEGNRASDVFVEEQPSVRAQKESVDADVTPVTNQPSLGESRIFVDVRSGDTLSKIAQRNRVAGYSLEQMLVGLFRKNRAAFDNDNMNRLRAGSRIQIPVSEELARISKSESSSEVKIHAADWQAFKSRMAGGENRNLGRSDLPGSRSDGGSIKQAPRVIEPSDNAKPSHVVRLSDGLDSDAALQEQLIATQQALEEQKNRAIELERIVADLRALSETKKTTSAGIRVESDQIKRADRPVQQGETELRWQEKLIGAILGQPLYLVIPVFLILILGLLVSRRLREMDDDEEAVATYVANEKIDTTSFSDAPMQSSDSEGKSSGEDFQDPVEDADIFLAYGRFSQAENILTQALVAEPRRLDLLLKLAEVYSRKGELSGFEDIAKIVADITRESGAYWERLLALGYLINPDDVRYSEGKFARNTRTAEPVDLSKIDLNLGQEPDTRQSRPTNE
ncbi:MAG: FimV/HubP family polar landmark protein [Betaproteobacteria bacterium]